MTASHRPVWLAGEDATFGDALAVGQEVLGAVRAALPLLPHKDITRPSAATMSEAVGIVHAREDLKKKLQASKAAKSKHKSGTTLASLDETRIPGAVQGGGDPSAFWMYVEVGGIGPGCMGKPMRMHACGQRQPTECRHLQLDRWQTQPRVEAQHGDSLSRHT
jgi:hypothetical protein